MEIFVTLAASRKKNKQQCSRFGSPFCCASFSMWKCFLIFLECCLFPYYVVQRPEPVVTFHVVLITSLFFQVLTVKLTEHAIHVFNAVMLLNTLICCSMLTYSPLLYYILLEIFPSETHGVHN